MAGNRLTDLFDRTIDRWPSLLNTIIVEISRERLGESRVGGVEMGVEMVERRQGTMTSYISCQSGKMVVNFPAL